MGILEFIVGLVIFILLLNIVFSVVPIPNGIVGVVIAILIIVLIWRLVF